jgi:hypothetical protein
MPGKLLAGAWNRWVAVLVAGVALWLFVEFAYWALGLTPAFAGAMETWESQVAFQTPTVGRLAVCIALAGILVLIHRFEGNPSGKRAASIGILLAIVPGGALIGAGDEAGLAGLAIARATIMMAGVVGASMLIHEIGSRRTALR